MITISKIQVVVFVNSLVSNISFGLNQKAQMEITYLKHGYRDFVLYFFSNDIPLFTTNKCRHKIKTLKFKIQHQEKHIEFFFHISLKRGKKFKVLTTSFLMLKSKYVKSRTTFTSSSIRLSKEIMISISSPNF